MRTIYIQSSPVEASHALAEHFVKLSKKNIAEKGSFHIALSGGNTPQYFFKLLTRPPYINLISWPDIHFYMTDERYVPISHPDSNASMIKRTLLNHIPITNHQIHFIQTENADAKKSASEYEQLLYQYLSGPTGKPQFDFILLGLGKDGHIASLFPESDGLKIKNKLTTANFINKLDSWRISLTYPIINNADNIAFLVCGSEKADIVHRIFKPDTKYPATPIQLLSLQGNEVWFFDTEAAKKIYK